MPRVTGRRPMKKPSSPRGQYSVAPELQCGFPTDKGPCKAPRQKWGNDYHPRCRHHMNADPEDLPLESLKDMRHFLADVMKRVRKGQLEPKIASALSQVARELVKVIVADMKLDPNKVAQRVITFEEAVKKASSMTIEEARQIADRNRELLSQMIHVEVVEKKEEDLIEYDDLPKEDKKAVTKAEMEMRRLVELVETGSPAEILEGLGTFDVGKSEPESSDEKQG